MHFIFAFCFIHVFTFFVMVIYETVLHFRIG